MIKYVVGFLFSKDIKNVLLIEKTKPDWQKGSLNGVGGKVEEGETPLDAMIREFQEEAALKITEWNHCVVITGDGFVVDFYRAFSDDIYQATSLTEEQIQVCDTFSLPNNVIYNLKWIIPFCLDNNSQKPMNITHIK